MYGDHVGQAFSGLAFEIPSDEKRARADRSERFEFPRRHESRMCFL